MNHSPHHRLQQLLDFVLDGSCSDADRAEFADLADRHPELLPGLLEQLCIHSLLQWNGEDVAQSLAALPLEDTTHFAATTLADTTALEDRTTLAAAETARPRRRLRRVAWAVGVSVCLLCGFFATYFTASYVTAHRPVAEVVDSRGVVWAADCTALGDGNLVHRGHLHTTSGTLTLRFRSGATVSFRGPTSLQIHSPMLVRLESGQATAEVPHWAKGFTIDTANVKVIDFGTRFGVDARGDTMTDVVVFEGEVDLRPAAGSPRVNTRLGQGEAARVDRAGAIDRIVEVRREAAGNWSTPDDPRSAGSVFRAIRDNIPPSDGSTYFYYEFSIGGLADDAPAYVDRHPHEWNGLTPDGLPPFLVGADYVRTFNDYRYLTDFELVVELAEPADLYVLFDDRVPTPAWLEEQFVDTGIKIGLDEGPWEGIPHHRTGVGGGVSIDNIFTIWHRRCDDLTPVTLGSVGPTSEARAMYGIAATPLKQLE